MLLLGVAEKIGSHSELGFDLFFAIAEVIVRNDGHNDAVLVPRRDLECGAVVVEFVRRLPTHAVATLPGTGLIPRRQPEPGLGQLVEMRGKNDTAGVSAPVHGVERGIVVGQIRVAGVAEDAFDKVQIANQSTRDKETHFHRFLGSDSRHFRADHGAKQQRDEALGLCGQGRGEGKPQQLRRWPQSGFQQSPEDRFGHGLLVVRNGKPAFGHVENALRRAAVAFRIVQHPLTHAVRIDDVGGKFVLVRRQRELARQSVAIKNERLVGQTGHLHLVLQVIVEKILNPRIRRTQVLGQQTVFLPVQSHEPPHQVGEFSILLHREGGTTEVAQLEIDVKETPLQGIRVVTAAGHSPQRTDFFIEILVHGVTSNNEQV